MKLFFLILFLPITALANNPAFKKAVYDKVLADVQVECEKCDVKINYTQVFDFDEDDIVISVSGFNLKGNTTIFLESEKRGTVQVPAVIRWFDKVVVAKSNIRHGKIITNDDIKVINKDVTYISKAYIGSTEPVVGKIGKRLFKRGQIIDESLLKNPRVVRYGQPIKLLLDNGALQMTVTGKSRGSGSVGDLIPVMITKTKKKVMAKIVDKNSARIE